MIPLENIVRVILYVNRDLHPWSSRHIYDKYIRTIVFSLLHVAVFKNVRTAGGPVIQAIPKIFFILLYLIFCKTVDVKFSVFLINTENNDTSLRIGKSRICLPKRTGKTSFCRFKFNIRRLVSLHKALQPFHELYVVKQCLLHQSVVFTKICIYSSFDAIFTLCGIGNILLISFSNAEYAF